MAILVGSNQYKIFNKIRKTPVLYPFLSQPIIEQILSMESYQAYSSEYSRIIFREKISKFFQTDLVYRKSKGDTTGILQIGLEQNIKRVYELCLEGYFARKQMINKSILENEINKVRSGLTNSFNGIFNMIAIEHWVESWSL